MRDTSAALPEPVDAVDRIPSEYPNSAALLWSAAEVASVLRVKCGTVETLYRCGDLEAVFVGKNKRFHPDDVRGLVAKLRGAAR